jgi:hypothetical protein
MMSRAIGIPSPELRDRLGDRLSTTGNGPACIGELFTSCLRHALSLNPSDPRLLLGAPGQAGVYKWFKCMRRSLRVTRCPRDRRKPGGRGLGNLRLSGAEEI